MEEDDMNPREILYLDSRKLLALMVLSLGAGFSFMESRYCIGCDTLAFYLIALITSISVLIYLARSLIYTTSVKYKR
jgi:lipoprotein signal peptidase